MAGNDRLRNPFIPMRVPGRSGLTTAEETSRVEDLIRTAWDNFIQQITPILVTATGATGTVGATGVPGRPGTDGDPGEDGAPGVPGAAGVAGAAGGRGVPGQDGDPGEDGIPGRQGVDGAAGAAGATGGRGVPGEDGEPGEAGSPGPAGATGGAGATGPQGPPGYIFEGEQGEEGPIGRPGAAGTTITGLGFVHADSFGGTFTRQGNGFTSAAWDALGAGIATTLQSGDSYVVCGPYTVPDGYILTVPDGAQMAVI